MQPDNNPHATPTAVVLYDGGCPLCLREITHYRRLKGADRLDWIDIAPRDDVMATFGVAKAEAMTRFHVKQADGQWATGAYGFAVVWAQLRGYRWLASFVRTFRLLPLLDWGYTRVTVWRLKRRCTSGSCETRGPAN